MHWLGPFQRQYPNAGTTGGITRWCYDAYDFLGRWRATIWI